MAFEALEAIHKLLNQQFELCESNVKNEKDKLDQAYRILEETENDPDCGPGAVEAANLLVETSKTAKYEAVKAADKIKRVLDEFETHEWR